MKIKIAFSLQCLLLSLCFFIAVNSTNAQTTLVKADIAFTGYIGNGATANTDEFSFVLLRNISANTVIKFTENGWLRTSATAGSFRTGEGTLQYTSLALPAGTEIRILCSATPTATYGVSASSAGTVTILAATEGNGAAPGLSANGDQLIAYQGPAASPTFITAIHMNVYSVALSPAPGVPGGDAVTTSTAAWDGSFSNGSASGLPSGTGVNFLTNGVDAIWIPGSIAAERDNARFNCSGSLGTVAQIKAAVFNVANWTTSDDIPTFTLPSNCPFLATTLPVNLLYFQGKAFPDYNLLSWKTADQVNFDRFELERHSDNGGIQVIATIPAQPGNGPFDYQFADQTIPAISSAVIHYRLKLIDIDGSFRHSSFVSVPNNRRPDLVITGLANPFRAGVQPLRFTIVSARQQSVHLQLTDGSGKMIFHTKQPLLKGNNSIQFPAQSLSSGIYYIIMENGTGERNVLKLSVLL